MGRFSRDKGGRGEREFIAILQPVADKVTDELGQPRLVLRRNQTQRFAPKQYDIIGIPWMAFEIKRHENLSGLNGWWKQTLAATGKNQIPVLAYRQNNRPWMIRMRVPISVVKGGVQVRMTVNVTLNDFLVWFEWKLRVELRGA